MNGSIKSFLQEHLPAPVRRRISRFRKRNRVDEVDIIHRELWANSTEGTMLDVGAHHGESLEEFALQGWRVFAFEPDSKNRAVLSRRVGSLPGVSIDPRAVSDHSQSGVAFFRSDVSSGISGLSAFHESHGEVGKVDLTTIAEVVAEQQLSSLQFLKIDTEGHDLEVLRGVPWEVIKPEAIVCEFEDRKTKALGYLFADLADYLVEHGYGVIVSEWYPIEEYGRSHRWRRFARYPCQLQDPNGWGNLIALADRGRFESVADALGC